ncbi:(Fe-S)-binding protein [[Eubacterium] cellulosolvens]
MVEKMNSINDFKEDVQKCMRCGFCVALCPVEEFMGFESNTPRGRMQTIKALINGEMKANEYLMKRIYNCSLCGYCLWRCPPGVKTTDAIKAARKYLVENKCYPEVLDTLEQHIQKNYHLYDLPKEARVDWINYMNVSDSVKIKEKADVIYFVGCVSALSGRAMEIPAAISQIFNKLGLDWTILGEDEVCCGTPLLLSGKTDSAGELARKNIEAIQGRGAKTVVTPCAGCYRVFIQDYPKLVGELGFEVLHTSQIIDNMLNKIRSLFKNEIKATAIYHDPCEIGRLAGLYDPPRRVLKTIPGLNLVDLPKTRELTRCCGGGGALKAVFPSTALRLAQIKLDEFVNANAHIVVSGCPSCKLNIQDAIAERESDLQMMDIAEIIAQALG